MALLKVVFYSVLLFATQQVQSSKADYNTDDVDYKNSKVQKANLLMVVQSYGALKLTDRANVNQNIDPTPPDWTLGYLLASKTAQASFCPEPPLVQGGPVPDESLVKIWPSIYNTDTKKTIEHTWKVQGACVEESEPIYKPKLNACGSSDDTNDAPHCYYKQAEQLYQYGAHKADVLFRCETGVKDYTVSSYVQQNLECLFKEKGLPEDLDRGVEEYVTKVIKNLMPEDVMPYFSNKNVYLGCQNAISAVRNMSNLIPAFDNGTRLSKEQRPLIEMCYITRVGLCYQCSVKPAGKKLAQCTPQPVELGGEISPPGTFTSCTNVATKETLPWYPSNKPERDSGPHQDVSCYNDCVKVALAPKDK